MIENVIEYWNSRPCNIRHSEKEIGTIEYFEEVEKRKYFVEPHIPKFASFADWKSKKVLEIGCGIGTDTVNFVKNGAKLTSVDISNNSLELTKQRMQVYGLEANLLWANAEELSSYVPVEVYDLVYSFGVLHHTPNPSAAFLECKKYMNQNSELRLMLYHKGAFKAFQILEQYNFDYANADALIAKHSEAQTGCPVTFSYTPDEITKLLEELGFSVTEISIDHIFPYKIEEYKKYQYVREDIWQMPEKTFSEFESKYGWHLLIKAKLK
jgi:ubiquinone/menaquinone biosynthesis C-methylase UbiE